MPVDDIPTSTDPTGPPVATNDKGGRHVQITQLDGGDDVTVAIITAGQKAMAASLPVVLPSDQSAIPTTSAKPGTATPSTPAMASGGSNTILAANANRLHATIVNTRTVDLIINVGAAASLTAQVARIGPRASWENPSGYTGIITGILATAGNDGNIAVTEFTA